MIAFGIIDALSFDFMACLSNLLSTLPPDFFSVFKLDELDLELAVVFITVVSLD